MRSARLLVPLAVGALLLSCGSIPNDPGPRIFPPAGVIRGTVVYQGPHPCSRNGHIVGNAVVLVFDRRNQPPPNGLANTAPNFGDVTGDTLFANEPRYQGDDQTYCPSTHGITDTITASGSFEIAPLAGGSYEIEAFFDYTGDWLPEFKIRNLPELGDIAGGDIDTADALKPGNVNNLNFQPRFIPVDVGKPQPLGSAGANVPNAIPNYVIPDTGFVTDNVTVTLGLKLPLTRPYFYAQGFGATLDGSQNLVETQLQSSDVKGDVTKYAPQQQPPLETPADPNSGWYAPVLTIPQDIQVHAPPTAAIPPASEVNDFEHYFPRLKLMAVGTGSEMSELPYATGPAYPFHMQVGAGLLVWPNSVFDPAKQQFVDELIPEGNFIPHLWPLVVLNKLVDDPPVNGVYHSADPASLTAQGDPNTPVVIMQAITEIANSSPPDTLYGAGFPEAMNALTNAGNYYVDAVTGAPKMVNPQNHVNALIRPSVICFNTLFDATNPDKRGVLVAPHITGDSTDNPPKPGTYIVPQDLLTNTDVARQSVKGLIKSIVPGCLPKGRYAINLVYPDGQAWTVPNEAGACSGTEGATNYGGLSCTLKPRPVLLSQGTRAVVEIVGPQDPMNCTPQGQVPPVPAACLPTAPNP